MKRRGALFLLLLLLASCCCAERGAKEADEKKERHARKAASRWARRAGRRKTDLVTATGGLCHFLETEAFSGASHSTRGAAHEPGAVKCASVGLAVSSDILHFGGVRRDVHGAEHHSLGFEQHGRCVSGGPTHSGEDARRQSGQLCCSHGPKA